MTIRTEIQVGLTPQIHIKLFQNHCIPHLTKNLEYLQKAKYFFFNIRKLPDIVSISFLQCSLTLPPLKKIVPSVAATGNEMKILIWNFSGR